MFGQPPEKMADLWDSLHGVKWDIFSWGTLWWDWGLANCKAVALIDPSLCFGRDGTMYLLRIRRVWTFFYKSHIHTDDQMI